MNLASFDRESQDLSSHSSTFWPKKLFDVARAQKQLCISKVNMLRFLKF